MTSPALRERSCASRSSEARPSAAGAEAAQGDSPSLRPFAVGQVSGLPTGSRDGRPQKHSLA